MIKIHLSDLLGKYRITQAELARKTGIRPATICDIYNEMCDRINIEHLDRICEVLGCDVADILEYQPNKIKKTGTNLILEQNGNRKRIINTKNTLQKAKFLQGVFLFTETFLQQYAKMINSIFFI